jgi:hypothetical protein
MDKQYVITGGQLYIDKKVFARELLRSDSSLKKLLFVNDTIESKQPMITKTEDCVIVDYNNASDIPIDENYSDFFGCLKSRYKEKLKGRITLRITFLSSFHMVLDLNSEDERILSEM